MTFWVSFPLVQIIVVLLPFLVVVAFGDGVTLVGTFTEGVELALGFRVEVGTADGEGLDSGVTCFFTSELLLSEIEFEF